MAIEPAWLIRIHRAGSPRNNQKHDVRIQGHSARGGDTGRTEKSFRSRIVRVRPVLLSAPYADAGNLEVQLHLPGGHRTCGLVEVTLEDGTTGLGEGYLAVFAPQVFKDRLLRCEVITEPKDLIKAATDHCPLIAELAVD